ncbi:MAG: lysine--tRNA ligase [Dermatophilaceae bacterium]
MSGAGTAHDWVSRMADELIAAADARDGAAGRGVGQRPIVCASGLSPSGPIHLGNLREVMTPHLVADEIRRRGRTVDHLLSWDDYDRFRKVPLGVEGVDDSWAEHIGRPLSSVPAPRGSTHPNWAAHFRTAMAASLAELGVEFRGISQTQMYTSGAYRDSILRAMRERATIDAILRQYRTKRSVAQGEGEDPAELSEDELAAAQGSGAADEDDGSVAGGEYFPYKPYCGACGRDTTTVTEYDEPSTTLSYHCGCGHQATMDLSRENHGKLVWKVDWPMRWAFEGVEFEPSGVDHSSPGSSYVVGGQIVAPVFGGWQPIGPMYAFVGIAGKAKMSSSTGGVPTPADALEIMEPQVLRWLYVRRRPNQSFTVAFNRDIHRMYDEWDALVRKVRAGKGQPADLAMVARSARTAAGELPRTPVPLPYRALCSVADLTGGLDEGDEGRSAQQLRILASMDTAVASLEDTRPRLDKAARWIATQADPEDRTVLRAEVDAALLASLGDHQRQALASLTDELEADWSLDGLTALVYGIPKRQAGLDVAEKKLPPEVKADQRAFFALIYRLLLGADTGPRIPTLLLCAGPGRVRHLLGA